MKVAVLVVLAAVAAACGGGASPTSTPPDEELTRFASQQYAYSIGYPGTWHVRKAARAISADELPHPSSRAVDWFGQFASADETTRIPGPQFEVSAHPVPEGSTVEAFADATIQLESREIGCERPDAREDTELDGQPAVLLAYTCHADASVLWVVAVHRGSGYSVIWLDDPGNEIRDRARFDRILETFAFTS